MSGRGCTGGGHFLGEQEPKTPSLSHGVLARFDPGLAGRKVAASRASWTDGRLTASPGSTQGRFAVNCLALTDSARGRAFARRGRCSSTRAGPSAVAVGGAAAGNDQGGCRGHASPAGAMNEP